MDAPLSGSIATAVLGVYTPCPWSLPPSRHRNRDPILRGNPRRLSDSLPSQDHQPLVYGARGQTEEHVNLF